MFGHGQENDRVRGTQCLVPERQGRGRVLFYVSMPPLEAKRALFGMPAKICGEWKHGAAESFWKLMSNDVKMARKEAMCDSDDVDVALSEEVANEGQCARLRKWLRGMRGALWGWQHA